MPHKVKIKLEDGKTKEFIISSDIDLPSGLKLTGPQITSLLTKLEGLIGLMSSEKWKAIEIETQ